MRVQSTATAAAHIGHIASQQLADPWPCWRRVVATITNSKQQTANNSNQTGELCPDKSEAVVVVVAVAVAEAVNLRSSSALPLPLPLPWQSSSAASAPTTAPALAHSLASTPLAVV